MTWEFNLNWRHNNYEVWEIFLVGNITRKIKSFRIQTTVQNFSVQIEQLFYIVFFLLLTRMVVYKFTLSFFSAIRFDSTWLYLYSNLTVVILLYFYYYYYYIFNHIKNEITEGNQLLKTKKKKTRKNKCTNFQRKYMLVKYFIFEKSN